MIEKNEGKNIFMEQDEPKGASENKKQRRNKAIILSCSIAILLIGIVIGGVFLFKPEAGVFSPDEQATVTFDSTGGTAIESRTVPKGGKLPAVGIPSRSGYIFAGWYYEEAPVNAYNEEDVFSGDTTLYAAWYEPDMELVKAEFIKDCDPDITFLVRSEVELTQNNLNDYIDFSTAGIEDGKTLSLKKQEGGYLLYSKDGFTPGNTYSIGLLDSKTVWFVKADEKDVTGQGITSYSFTVYKENINNAVKKAKPKLLSSDIVSSFDRAGEVADGETGNENDNGKTIYRATLVKDDVDYKAGDIISLGNGEKDAPGNQYYKVFKVTKKDKGILLDLIAPNIDDIYSELDVYYSGDAASFEEDANTDTLALTRSLKTSLENSPGYDYVCTTIAKSIKDSPTLKKTVAELDTDSRKRFNSLSLNTLKDMFKNVKFDIEFGKTKDISNNDSGCYGKIKFTTGDITLKLDDNIKLTINLTMSENITTTAFGWYKIDRDLKLYTDSGVYLNNEFSMSFSAVIETDSGMVNITDEIQKLVDFGSADKTQSIVDNLNKENLFGDDLDYIEVLSKQLGEKTITIYEILSIQFTLDFKVSLGMRAGLELNFNSTELRKIGMCNIDYSAGSLQASKTKMNYYNERLKTELHFDATLKGKVGVRAGFEAGVNFSMVHLNKVLNFGFAAEVGVYEEISGYLRFDYDYINASGTSSSAMSLAGGLKSETGIYVELSFTWNIFGWEDGVTLAEFKFPILTIGSLEFASEFEKDNDAVTFNTTSYNIKNGSNDLLKLKYVDITGGSGGVTINIRPASLSDDYKFFTAQDITGKGGKEDLKYVSLDSNTGIVSIADNAPERLDFTVVVQYTKGCSLFSKGLTPIIKNINFTYMKYKVDDSTKKFKARFYRPDGSLLEQKEFYVGQIPVPPAEDTYEELFLFTRYRLKTWAKPWIEDFAAIYEDTDYHLDWEYNYKNINFFGDIYNEATGKYQYGLIATVPTLCGEVPIPPASEDMVVPGWEFMGWSPELREVQTDYNYTAMYRQDPDYCLCHFYVDGNIITAGYVKIGDTPSAPDMSKYNTGDRKFTGWWPALGPTTTGYQIYDAIFRKYVNVTFEDRDGKVLFEQRILAGETPEAPKMDSVVEGEEDYYEYRFKRWETENGAKIDQVYKDTVYSPVYDKKYLEVKTIFDAGSHAFADGTKTKEYKGVYAKSQYASPNILNLPQVTYRDNENTYTVNYWQSTEKVKGSYVKLYMKDNYTHYKYNLTFTPVFKAEPVVYTVRFDGGDKAVYVTGHYGDVITSDMLSDLKKTSAVNNYVYELRDYGLTLPYSFGSTNGADGLPAVYISVVARFELVGINKTFTFDANGGKFTDNTTVKTVAGLYGSRASFTDVPVKANDERYTYAFAGWADSTDATSGSGYSDFVINGDKTLYAVYSRTLRNYTITFDADEGYFSGGASTINQSYHYGDTIVPPANPVRDATAVYRYVFIGWQPALSSGTTVSVSRTYIAAYRSIRIDGTLEETGIIVSDGSSYEDICVNSISGYTYALVGAEAVPTLTVTGNGLTFSGTSSEVCVIIGTGVTDVTFDDLTLSGAYSDVNGILSTAETAGRLTVNISGSCVIRNTEDGEPGVSFERPVLLNGMGTDANLSISGKGNYTVYCSNILDADSLELSIDSVNTAIGNDDGAGGEWLFNNSTINITAGGAACEIMCDIKLDDSSMTITGESGIICRNFEISGASTAELTASGESAVALRTGELKFADFNGSFSAGSTHLTSPGVAVMAFGGIKFEESGTDVGPGGYDLDGAQIASFEDAGSGTSYSSFGIDSGGTLVPASAVTVTKQ